MPLKSRDLAVKAAKAALQKKALDVTILDVSGLTVIADYFVICSGESTTQVKAVANFIEEELKKKRRKPLGIEGVAHSHWILLDYGDVIIHVFERETRAYYNLEKLWMDAKIIEINEDKSNMAGEDKRAIFS
ncbi:MAG: ribosome silencing factor [Nitrospira bacterium HGW-Nitrospira-1]|nr:MAG: ribosome silencing factor [Nitrospira bacterium HGW-Nitrospira-1]